MIEPESCFPQLLGMYRSLSWACAHIPDLGQYKKHNGHILILAFRLLKMILTLDQGSFLQCINLPYINVSVVTKNIDKPHHSKGKSEETIFKNHII